MFKDRSNVFPTAVRVGLAVVSLVFLNETTTASVSAQETPPQTEEQREARQALNQGVQSFKNGQYDEAIAAFQRAKLLDPRLMNARLYLATAYAAQYIPGAPSEANQELGRKSVEEFRGVLDFDPQNLSAIDGIGSILFHMAGEPFDPDLFAESKTYHQKHIQLRPLDTEPYYWIGVIDWTLAFRANAQIRARSNLSVRGKQLSEAAPLPPELRGEYIREYGATIDEGIESLKRAITPRPEYDDAMAYLNLLYRRKADTVDYQDERDGLLKMADELVDKVKDIKMKRAKPPSP